MVVASRNGESKSIINSNSSNNINNENNNNNNNNRSVKIFIMTLGFISALCYECDYDFDYDVV